ncbi:MAG: glycosyltransferase [Betaproteobacteria bacterium]|nr:glycosyltransferase [Betaproteobacteria bacterium]
MLERMRQMIASRNDGERPDAPAAAAPAGGVPCVLNVGGGSKAIAIPPLYASWTQVLLDIKAKPDVDLVCDARRLGELAASAYDAVYCSHNLEHYYRHEVPQVLAGFAHVLKDDGFCEIRVPDMLAAFEYALAAGEDLEATMCESEAGPVSTLDLIYGFDQEIRRTGEPYYAHRTGFSALTLERALQQAGFAETFVLRHPGYELRALAFKAPFGALRRREGSARAVDALYAFGCDAWQVEACGLAARAARAALGLDATLPALHYLLGCAELEADHWCEAHGAFEQCLALAPDYPLTLQARLHAAVARARQDLAAGTKPSVIKTPEKLPDLVSVVICSARPERLARAKAAYERAFTGIAHELVAVTDARSLAEGYNRGLRASRGELVVFSHDDIDIAAPDFAARLLRHMQSADLVGVAGTTQVVTASWLGAGWSHLAGQIAIPEDGGSLIVTAYGCRMSAGGAQALDGVFLACRRELAQRIGFDAATFDGWHGYDFDFSFRAYLGGYRCAVAGDLLLAHESIGSFDRPEWRRYAQRALEKHRGSLPPDAGLPQQPQLCSIQVRSATEWQVMSAYL